MLVLTRRKDETIVIRPLEPITLTPEDVIEIVFLEIRGGRQCRVGLTAPKTIRLSRGQRDQTIVVAPHDETVENPSQG